MHDFAQGTKSALMNFYSEALDHPKKTISSLVNSLAANPQDVFIPQLAGARAARMGTFIAERVGEGMLARSAPGVARAVGEIYGGAGIGAVEEASEQFKTGEANLGAVGNAAIFGAGFGAADVLVRYGLLKGKKPSETFTPSKVYSSEEEALRVIQPENIVPGYAEAKPVETGKHRFSVDFAETEGEKASKKFVLRRDKTDRTHFFVDLTPEEIATMERHPEGFTAPTKEFKNKLSPYQIAKGEEFIQTVKNLEQTPEKIIPFLIKNGPPALATGAIITGLGMWLYDEPADKTILGSIATASAITAFTLLSKYKTGNKTVSNALADMLGVQDLMKFKSRIFEQASKSLVGEEGLVRILKSFDPSENINLSPQEVLVKSAFKKSITALANSAQQHGIKFNLFAGEVPLRVVDGNGNLISRSTKLELEKHTSFKDLEELLAQNGGSIETKNIADVLNFAAQEIFEKVSRKRFIEELAQYQTLRGDKWVIKEDFIPGYEKLRNPLPGFESYRFHKDIIHEIAAVFESKGWTGSFERKLLGAASALKRVEVSYSLFHAKTLLDGMLGVDIAKGVNPKELLQKGTDALLGKIKGPEMELLIRNGLKIGTPVLDMTPEEMNREILALGKMVDKIVPGGIATKGAEKAIELGHALDTFTFGFLQNGFKISTALMKLEQLLAKGVPEKEAAQIASSFANDIFGGQNWFRVMNSSSNAVLRNIGNSMITGSGMGWMRLLMFAPDWKFATFRSLFKALPGVADKDLQLLHAKYLLKSAILYAAVGDSLNYIATGHHVFENHDPTKIELGEVNGRPQTMSLSKHFLEFFNFAKEPIQQMLNGLNPMIKLPFEIALNKEYLAFSGSPSMVHPSDTNLEVVGDVFRKFLSPFVPITMQQIGDPGRALTGFVGMPMGGQDADMQRKNAVKRKQDIVAQRQESAARRGESLNSKSLQSLLESLGIR
jgi:hypothetical protein